MDAAANITDEALFEQHEDLRRLQTALTRAHRFALIFAVCNAPSYRNRLVEALLHTAQRPLIIVHLKPLEDNPTMDAQIAEALEGAPPDAAAFVFGLENLLPTNDAEKQFNTLRQLNWRRAGFGRLACPVVFWLPDYALTLIANEAPDFHDWYSGVYTFVVPAAALPDALPKTLAATGDFDANAGLSLAEKQRWRETLEELVAEPRTTNMAEQQNRAVLLNRLGSLAMEMADYTAAIDYFSRAIEIIQTLQGEEHPNVAVAISNLGIVLANLNDLNGAKAALERALQINEAAYGPNHPAVARDIGNLGLILYKMDALDEAKAALERALQINMITYGPEHHEVAVSIGSLGSVLNAMGDLLGAKNAYEHALRIDEGVYGVEHPAVATDVSNLGNILRRVGDLEGAKIALERARSIYEAAYGVEHPAVARSLGNIGLLLHQMGDLEGAKTAIQHAFSIFQRFFGEDHPDTQLAKENLENVLADIAAANKSPY